MSTFLCSRCGAVENTATSDYWVQLLEKEPPLCSKCSSGVWHGRFERRHWSYYGIDQLLKAQKKDVGDFINAREHLRNIGVIGSKKETYKEVNWED